MIGFIIVSSGTARNVEDKRLGTREANRLCYSASVEAKGNRSGHGMKSSRLGIRAAVTRHSPFPRGEKLYCDSLRIDDENGLDEDFFFDIKKTEPMTDWPKVRMICFG